MDPTFPFQNPIPNNNTSNNKNFISTNNVSNNTNSDMEIEPETDEEESLEEDGTWEGVHRTLSPNITKFLEAISPKITKGVN